jgi:hypothetical protein
MPLINIVVVLILVGVALHLINRYLPMASSIKSILNVVVIVCVCVWLLQAITGAELYPDRAGNWSLNIQFGRAQQKTRHYAPDVPRQPDAMHLDEAFGNVGVTHSPAPSLRRLPTKAVYR